jgi:hypothetical protein
MCAKGVTTVIAVDRYRFRSTGFRPLAIIGTNPGAALATLAGPRHWVVA